MLTHELFAVASLLVQLSAKIDENCHCYFHRVPYWRNTVSVSSSRDRDARIRKERKKYLSNTQELFIAQSIDNCRVQHNEIASKLQVANSVTIRVCKSDLKKRKEL